MTSKAVISQLEVNERRLKGIYDQLEGGNFKKAICEADKVLKKNPNLLPAKVLKGLALYRLGKSIESFSIIDEVAKLTPTDENTLNSLAYFYKESEQKSKIVEIYEEANKKCPNREDICANLFYCHTKNFDFLSQQKVATQLKKINVNHIEYVMWPIISNVLHGVYNNDQRLIKLGEATLARYIKSNSILTVEIIEFFIYTLEKVDKLSECLEWLNGSVLKDVIENNQNKQLFDRYKIDILLKLDRKLETCDLYWRLLENNRVDVCMWRDYIDVITELNLDDADPHSIRSVVKKLKSSDIHSMAIKVAMIHMSLKLSNTNVNLSNEFGSKVDKIVDYFIEFGDKPSCLYDLYSFLALETFSHEDRCAVISKIIEHIGPLEIEHITDTKLIEKHCAVENLKRAISSPHMSEILKLIEIYEHGLQFSATISSSEIKPCDNFAKLAASRLYDDWLMNNKSDNKPLIEAVKLLRHSINQSSANYHLRLQLSHLFGLLCCQDLLIDQFNDLEIKQLMWDSLGYFYILPILQMPSFQQRILFFRRNVDRKLKNKLEIEESLVTCYKLGNYSKIPEIIEFHRDIESSVISNLGEVEIYYVNTILKSNSCDDLFECFSSKNLPEIEISDTEMDIVARYSHLKDFRDLNTSPDFGNFNRLWTDNHKKLSFDHILLWTCQRVLIIRSFYSAAKLTMETVVKLDRLTTDSTLSFESETSNNYKILDFSSRQLIEIWDKMEAVSGSYHNLSTNLTGSPEPPQNAFGRVYVDAITSCLRSLTVFHDAYVRRLPDVPLKDFEKNISMPFKSVIDQILSIHLEETNVFCQVPEIIVKLTLVSEILSWITLIMSLIENMTKPLRPKLTQKRRNKKKKSDQSGDINPEPKSEQMKILLETTNFHKLPILLTESIETLDNFILKVKQVLRSLEGTEQVIVSITASWITTLDNASDFIKVKKTSINNIKKIIDEEMTTQCLFQMNNVKLDEHL